MKPNLGLSPTLRLHWPASENEIREPSRRHQNPLTRACQRLEGDGRPFVHTNGALCSATHRPPPKGHAHALPPRSCSAQGPIEEHTPRRILRGRAQSAGGARRRVRPRGVPVNQGRRRASRKASASHAPSPKQQGYQSASAPKCSQGAGRPPSGGRHSRRKRRHFPGSRKCRATGARSRQEEEF